ncbi:MAG: hypothetical protein H0X73_07360 [Chthoniobacterales bacterium]|nr:hypothetical protein [Chthoniobacterales bacterium]
MIKRIPIMIALFLGGMLIAVWCPNHGRNARRYVLHHPAAHFADKYGREPFVIVTFGFFTLFPLILL